MRAFATFRLAHPAPNHCAIRFQWCSRLASAGFCVLLLASPALSHGASAVSTAPVDVQAIAVKELGCARPFVVAPLPPINHSAPSAGSGQALAKTGLGPGTLSHHIPDKYDVGKIGDRHVGSGFDLYSLQKEQTLGRSLAAEVERTSKLVKDSVITEYVNRIGQNLVRNSDAKVPFTIKVIDNDEINAFALPGGFFYVDTGLILAADNEAELAGVMAHEIAHVAARHATKNATRSQIFNLASIPLIFVGGPVGYAVRQAVGLAMPMSFLKFSRDAEREADLLGMEYQYASGYDPEEFVKFFEKLHAQEKKQKHGFLAKAFATHPMTGDRIKRAQKAIAEYLPARDEYIVDTSEFDQVKARLIELQNAHRIDGGDGIHPTLRRRP